MRLDGKIALVTGAGSGIGRALAAELGERRALVILAGRRLDALQDSQARLPYPERGIVVDADITSPRGRDQLIRRVEGLGRLDLLVNNAGVVVPARFEEEAEDDRRAMIETNLLAPMALTQALLPWLRAAGRARVVNVGSLFGDIAFPCFASYSASKFGLRGWSDALRRELSGSGVGVTYVAPRATRTPAAEGFGALTEAFAMRFDAPERVARRIADAIEADKAQLYPGGGERLFLLAQRLAPGLMDRGLRRATRQALAVLKA